MNLKVTIRLGELEVKYEGSEEFLKYELANTISSLAEIDISNVITTDSTLNVSSNIIDENISSSSKEFEPLQLTLSTIASQLNVKTGTDLVLAACAHLTLVNKKEKFRRSDILEDMKTATGFYNANQGRNLSASLKTLIKQKKIAEIAKDTYALTADSAKELGAKLD